MTMIAAYDAARIKARMWWRLNRAWFAKQSILVRVDIDFDARTVTCVDPHRVFNTAGTIRPFIDSAETWYDPTYGRIDRDIQEYVASMHPESLAQKVAIENTLQRRRDGGYLILGVRRPKERQS